MGDLDVAVAVASGSPFIFPGMAGNLREKLNEHPPDLRRGNAKARCALCRHFDGRGQCILFGWRVRPTELCDAFEPKAGGGR